MQLVGPEGYTLCRPVLQMEDVSDFVLEYVLVLAFTDALITTMPLFHPKKTHTTPHRNTYAQCCRPEICGRPRGVGWVVYKMEWPHGVRTNHGSHGLPPCYMEWWVDNNSTREYCHIVPEQYRNRTIEYCHVVPEQYWNRTIEYCHVVPEQYRNRTIECCHVVPEQYRNSTIEYCHVVSEQYWNRTIECCHVVPEQYRNSTIEYCHVVPEQYRNSTVSLHRNSTGTVL